MLYGDDSKMSIRYSLVMTEAIFPRFCVTETKLFIANCLIIIPLIHFPAPNPDGQFDMHIYLICVFRFSSLCLDTFCRYILLALHPHRSGDIFTSYSHDFWVGL